MLAENGRVQVDGLVAIFAQFVFAFLENARLRRSVGDTAIKYDLFITKQVKFNLYEI